MGWDILIAIGIGLTQLIITWYAVDISVKEQRLRNAIIIIFVGVVGIGLTVFGTVRNGRAQGDLKAQLDHIQKNTETPPTVNVTVPPATVIEKQIYPRQTAPPAALEPSLSGLSKGLLGLMLQYQVKAMRDVYQNYWIGEDKPLFDKQTTLRMKGDNEGDARLTSERSQLRTFFETQMTDILKEEEELRIEALRRTGSTQEDRDEGAALSIALKNGYGSYEPSAVINYGNYLDKLAKRLSQ